jgi:acetylornithine deacetylase
VPAVRLRTVPGMPAVTFPFTTDVPLLDRWGEPLLFGPGSFLAAHTDHEHVPVTELEQAVHAHEQLVTSCLTASA